MLGTTSGTSRPLRLPAAVLVLVLACQIAGSGESQAQQLPPGPQRNLVLKECTTCHEVPFFGGLRKGREGWRHVMDDMRDMGADATNEEFEQIISYLTAELGVPLRINRATAIEIQAAMDLTPAQAQALVAYRAKRGPFRNVDDLLKAPDIPASRIREQTKNLRFD